MIGPLNSLETGRLASLPRIARARGHRLYALDGSRWLDCWADGGRALLGHQTKGLSKHLKNEIDRGLLAPYPSRWNKRLEKTLLRLYPGYAQALVFRNFETAMTTLSLSSAPLDPLDSPGVPTSCHSPAASSVADTPAFPSAPDTSRVLWGRPLLPKHPEADILFPLLPLPEFSEVQVVLLRENYKVNCQSNQVSALALVGMIRVCASLEAVENEWDSSNALFSEFLADIWERRGPYMLFRGNEKEYEFFFKKLIAQKVLVAPSSHRPSILPPGLTRREALILSGKGAL